jgi:hypothetical protein
MAPSPTTPPVVRGGQPRTAFERPSGLRRAGTPGPPTRRRHRRLSVVHRPAHEASTALHRRVRRTSRLPDPVAQHRAVQAPGHQHVAEILAAPAAVDRPECQFGQRSDLRLWHVHIGEPAQHPLLQTPGRPRVGRAPLLRKVRLPLEEKHREGRQPPVVIDHPPSAPPGTCRPLQAEEVSLHPPGRQFGSPAMVVDMRCVQRVFIRCASGGPIVEAGAVRGARGIAVR